MKPRTRIILLSVISILIVVTIVLGITYSFMQANIDSSEVTEVSLSSCAKITLEDAGVSIDLNNTNPISKYRALETTPYTFTITSSCESYVGFNLYLATLNTNTLADSNIHYIITSQGSKDILAEGILSEATNALSEFTSDDQNQLNIGINGTFATIYRLYNDSIPLQGENSYDLYLYIDSEVTDASTMGGTFNAGIAVKSYDRQAEGLEVCIGDTLSNCITNVVYTTDGENGLYYHDGTGSYTNASQEAGDNSYRYTGANPNNYVCFGSAEEVCPADNLYRIIGVFDGQVKLIKNASIGNYYWSGSESNRSSIWSASTLNTDVLNKTYLNGLGAEWSKKIEDYDWQVGGMDYETMNTAKQYFEVEVGANAANTIYKAKIGLLYVSDYGYAAGPENWATELYSYESATSSNWLYLGSYEWTISRSAKSEVMAFHIGSAGYISDNFVYNNARAIRPAFYLKNNIILTNGTGTSADPYRIA